MAVNLGQELLIVLLLILANGFFAAAEIALIAARRGRLSQWAEEGDRAAKAALELAKSPQTFLPTIQIGITVIGTFAAAFGGAKAVGDLQGLLERIPVEFVARNAENIALLMLVGVISAAGILLGELVPKRLALRDPPRFARFAAYPIMAFVWVLRPVLWVVDGVCNFVLRSLGFKETGPTALQREDIEQLLQEGESGGILNPVERQVAAEALRLGDRTVKDVMQPRIDIDGIDVETPPEEVLGVIAMAGFTRLPVYEGDLDHIIGFIHAKDVLRQLHLGWKLDLRRLLHAPLFVPETLPLDKLLLSFREQRTHLAVVLDEFGGTEGVVTLDAVLGELVGEIRDEHSRDSSMEAVRRGDGSWLIDGMLNIDDLVELLELKRVKLPTPRSFTTVAGLVLEVLGRLPRVGETLEWHGVYVEVVDMDGPRIDRLLIRPPTNGDPAAPPA
jgi:putative hemolysin